MITGAHSIIYSTNPDADRAFFRDVLDFPHVNVGNGWLIFALPSAELAVHPAGNNNIHELYLTCDDIESVIENLSAQGVPCGEKESLSWGMMTRNTLPGGGKLGIYEPHHARPG